MRTGTRIFGLAALLLFLRCPSSAHHAFAAEFDAGGSIVLTGAVTKISWLNPHTRFYMRVRDGRGAAIQWEMVLGSPNVLIRQGWTRTFLKEGDQITVTGFRAKDGSHMAAARTVRFPNGQTANFGSAGDGGPSR